MTAARRVFVCTLALGAGGAGLSAQKPQRYPLRAEAIVRALHADGLEVQVDQVTMPVPVNAAVENPNLELFGAERLPNGEMRMRLRCHEAGTCVAFSVMIHRTGKPAAALQNTDVATLSPQRETPHVVATPIPSAPLSQTEPSATPEASIAVHTGTKLTLLLEDNHMRIHIPVLAMDSAPLAGEMRVCTPDHKRIFRATVVDATTVRGIAE